MIAFLVWKSRFICEHVNSRHELLISCVYAQNLDIHKSFCYLFGSFIFNELLINTVGLGRQVFL